LLGLEFRDTPGVIEILIFAVGVKGMGLAVFGLPADVVLYALDNDVTPAKVLLIF